MKKRILNLISILMALTIFAGCSASKASEKSKSDNVGQVEDDSGEEEEETTICVLFVKVEYESNVLLAKYSIDISLDGEEIATISNGKEYFGSFEVESGEHQLFFEKNGDADNCNDYIFDVDSDCTVYCSLKSHMDHIEITEKNVTDVTVCPDDKHQWEEATCKSPKTCKVCGATEGGLVDHTPGTWQTTKDATCMEEGEESAVCSICGETITRKVDKTEHNIAQWESVKAPTCTEEGEEKGVCSVCGQEMTRKVEKIPHDPGDWTITKEATVDEPGVRVRKCKVCDEVIENENYVLTEEEGLKWLKKNAKGGLYTKISRDPNQYVGEYVKFSGKVVQVCYESGSAGDYSQYRIATKNGYDDVVYALINISGKSRILENDKITIYGKFSELYTYTTVMGSSVTIPLIYVIAYE